MVMDWQDSGAAGGQGSEAAYGQGSPLKTVKGLATLLYRMGRTFDGLNSSYIATEDFVRTGNPRVLGSKNDLALLQDLTDAARYTVGYDYANRPFDLTWLRGINGSMTRTAAIEPRVLRQSANILVSTGRGPYQPPVPNARAIEDWLVAAAQPAPTGHALLAQAVELFARLAKAQPFGDGNKRSALLAANGLLMRAQSPLVLSVPADTDDAARFNDLLTAWYLEGDAELLGWLLEWNLR
ncbi:hypothetical protein KIM372_04470 [Bombiscardovia nodaiensis]|uniref:Fido domain-containing protein n=1 Tax=Bombiscardovia nodaiensis TaxID=2932181 RepID=A0ABN6SCB1_9BIFI|nr:hypothetical protein KIM372_04470 [Bombiscardovia nodaiensis]